jgi:carbohydrate-selective porin OprB
MVTPSTSLQPALSYTTNPSTDLTMDDAVIGMLKMVIEF